MIFPQTIPNKLFHPSPLLSLTHPCLLKTTYHHIVGIGLVVGPHFEQAAVASYNEREEPLIFTQAARAVE